MVQRFALVRLVFGLFAFWAGVEMFICHSDIQYPYSPDFEGCSGSTGERKRWIEKDDEEIFIYIRKIDAVDGYLGRPIGGGAWSGMIGMILRGEADVTLLQLTYMKNTMVTHLYPLSHVKTNVYFHFTTDEFTLLNIFKPLHKSIWLGVITWIIIGSHVLWYCNYVALKNGLQGNEDVGYISCFFFLIQTISNQGYHITPKVVAIRVLFITCYVTALLLLTGYSAVLISSLTAKPHKPYDNLYQLLESGHKLIGTRGTIGYQYFEAGETDIVRKIFKKLIVPSGVGLHFNVSDKDAYKEVARLLCEESGYAIVTNDLYVTLIFPYFQPKCEFSQFSKPLLINTAGMVVDRHSPFKTVINHNILRLIERGILRRVTDHYIKKRLPYSSGEDPLITVNFFAILGIFVFFVGAVIASIIILVIEKLHYFHYMSKKSDSATQ